MNAVSSLRRLSAVTFTFLALGACAQAASLAIRENGPLVDIVFTGTHTLERADTIKGQWITLGNQTDVFTDPDSGTVNQRFYRINDGGVYSDNAVGYYRMNICQGYTLVANQLNTFSNTITNLFKSPPEGTYVFKLNPVSDVYADLGFVDGVWEGNHLEMTLYPGEGIFIRSPAAFVHRFLGEVLSIASVPVPVGWSILSAPLPEAGPVALAPPNGPGFPYVEGDQILQWNCSSGAYRYDIFLDGIWQGDDSGASPSVAVGEAFFLNRSGSAWSWNRTFSVGP